MEEENNESSGEYSEEEDEEEEEERSYTGSEDETESESGSDDESDEYEEPFLKYDRFAKGIITASDGSDGDVQERTIICCMAVLPKFIALGTHDGTIKLVDHNGTPLKDRVYGLHGGKVNQISVDEAGEVMASCSDDRKVNLIGLFTTKYNNSFSFEKPVKSVAIHPLFSKGMNHSFVIGTDLLLMIEERRWPLSNKVVELHGGHGIISTIKWKGSLVAWTNERMVVVYDTTLKERIASISFDEESPSALPCSIWWQDAETLLVGRGHSVKTVVVKEQDQGHSGDMSATRKPKYMAISAQNTFVEFLICGVVSLRVDGGWMLVVLGYTAAVDQEEGVIRGTIPPPHLLVVPPGNYNREEERFDAPQVTTRDKLLPKGYSFCRCEEYHLECGLGEDRVFILTPIDIIVAQRCGANDHVDWLLEMKKFEEAIEYADKPTNARMLRPGKLQEIGLKCIYNYITLGNFKAAAQKCHEFLGPKDKFRWEDIIYSFMNYDQLPVILPFVPVRDPQLAPATYEVILNTFLQKDSEEVLLKVIDAWPKDLYDQNVIINAVQEKLKTDPDSLTLLKVKALLHELLGQYEEALKIYLKQGEKEVFGLIYKHNLYHALTENLLHLMLLDLSEAVRVLIDCRDKVPPDSVVRELDQQGYQEEFLHKYLDGLYEKDPKAGNQFHERQVELYAKYDREKLLLFLRSCNDIPLKKALDVCEHYQCYEQMVYLLARMGNPRTALELIIKKLEDVSKAIQFTMEEGDDDMWELLISLSVNRPEFITGLLKNVGTHIDPTKLIQRIPLKTQIPDLGNSLVKLLQDYRLQVNLREGCKKILVKDSQSLMEKLHRKQKRGVCIEDDAVCKACGTEAVGTDENSKFILFFCGHIYHEHCCSLKRNNVYVCRLCYAGTKSKRIEGSTHRLKKLM